jgi:hypothetical protein
MAFEKETKLLVERFYASCCVALVASGGRRW